MKRILVSGSNGFVGKRLCSALAESGHSVTAVVRSESSITQQHSKIAFVHVGDIGPETDWQSALIDTEVIIHLAARVHVMKEQLKDPLSEYSRVNVEGTKHLALTAARAGVRRFVYVSTIKVNGESTQEKPFNENDIPSPQDAYAISKWESEQALHEISSQTGLEIVIIRPPLVYGPGVKGNMLALMRYIDHGFPLPFGGIRNSRSLISLDNLLDILILSATKHECAGHTFLVSDGLDISTSDLLERISAAMLRKSRLIKFPDRSCSLISHLVPALRPVIERLTGSLVIDSTKFRSMFDWNPPQTPSEGIESMVSYYLQSKSCNINKGGK